MPDWPFVLTPLLVLPIVLLFRFIGCGVDLSLEPDPPFDAAGYGRLILAPGEAADGVIAYWRLLDPPGLLAADEKKFDAGTYGVNEPLPDEPASGGNGGSASASGGFEFNQKGLIGATPAGRLFAGGYVMVDAKDGLYTEEFTLEAWIRAVWPGQNNRNHTLFSAGGFYRRPGEPSESYHGFQVFANGENRWQVRLFPGGEVLPAPPIVPQNRPSHVALTVESTGVRDVKKRVRFYVNGNLDGDVEVNFYSRPLGAPLFIGITNREADPSKPKKFREPMLSPIQEVVLHKRALPAAEIQRHYQFNESYAQSS